MLFTCESVDLQVQESMKHMHTELMINEMWWQNESLQNIYILHITHFVPDELTQNLNRKTQNP